jgi:nicotinamidase-related amidase
MKTIGRTKVFTELSEVLDPKHTALLIIDVQGNWHKEKRKYRVVERIAKVLQAARRNRVMVIYSHNVRLFNHSEVSGPVFRLLIKDGYEPGRPLRNLKGSPKTEIVPEIAPKKGEAVIVKSRSSAFVGTALDMILRSNGVLSLVLVGGATDWCVEATTWDATGRDYYVVVLEDCVTSRRPEGHRSALKQMALIADTAKAEDAIAIWKRENE